MMTIHFRMEIIAAGHGTFWMKEGLPFLQERRSHADTESVLLNGLKVKAAV